MEYRGHLRPGCREYTILYHQCGLCALGRQEGLPHLVPYLCALDTMSVDWMGGRLYRTKHWLPAETVVTFISAKRVPVGQRTAGKIERGRFDDACGVSPGLSHRHYRKGGIPPPLRSAGPHLLRQRRMERAAELLHTPELSLEGVAKAVGYSSVSQFIAAFRQQYWADTGPVSQKCLNRQLFDRFRDVLEKDICYTT